MDHFICSAGSMHGPPSILGPCVRGSGGDSPLADLWYGALRTAYLFLGKNIFVNLSIFFLVNFSTTSGGDQMRVVDFLENSTWGAAHVCFQSCSWSIRFINLQVYFYLFSFVRPLVYLISILWLLLMPQSVKSIYYTYLIHPKPIYLEDLINLLIFLMLNF